MTQREARDEYEARMAAQQRRADQAWSRVRALGSGRLAVFVLFLVMAWAVTERHLLTGAWLWLPIAAFAWLVVRHREAVDTWERALRSVTFYDDGIHRIDDDWQGRGVGGEQFADPAHPYTSDLDIFGRGSLFDLLCIARTAAGEERLASWLRAPAPVDELRQRQAAVAELVPMLDLREDMAVSGKDRRVIDHERLAQWGERPVTLTSLPIRVVAAIFGAVTFAALAYWAAGYDPRPFIVLFVVEQSFALITRKEMGDVIRGIDRPRRDLQRLARYLARLEREQFQSPLLQRLRATLDGHPSKRLRRLITLMEYAESWRNIFFAPFAIVLLWALQFAFAIEGWRRRDGAHIRQWLDSLAQFEALLSLSAFAYEHPMDVFPELVSEGPRFDGVGLAHPLLPLARAVRNDVRLDREQQLMLVSGSNMAGKSSLLRTVGVATVLGLAGATVRARSLKLSPLAVGACMRIQDSLQAGVSHFYAEIKRLRLVVDLASDDRLPLLFLFDEILHGTNSYDRSIGAEAVVRTLVSKGAIGLVTTHDLALTRIVDTLAPRAINVHFQDEMVDGTMTFDYTLHPGVVEKSNAIALMRAVGLEV